MEPQGKKSEGPHNDSLTAASAATGPDSEINDPPQFWRSLDELNGSSSFKEEIENEFPRSINEFGPETLNRRNALKVMAASAALAGLTGCTKLPTQHIVPYVRQPELVISGQPLFYATAITLGGIACGVLAESHMGRPTKIEGNPDHPASLGAADCFAQAATLSLYDPDRSHAVVHDGRIGSWNEFERQLTLAVDGQKLKQGAGLRILTETVTSPSLAAQIQKLLGEFPQARWHQYESTSRHTTLEGCRLAFGEYANPVYRIEQAQVILSLDSDFLCSGPGNLRYARQFTGRRRADSSNGMSRLYVVEATPTNTGAMADHRLPLRASEIESVAREVARQLGVAAVEGRPLPAQLAPDWIPALVRDLQSHRGASLIVSGDQQPPIVHALAHAMNERLGNVDKTVYFTKPLQANPVDEWQSLNELAIDLRADRVELLMILGGNPAYDAPADLDIATLFPRVPFSVRLGLYEDETSAVCHWHIPEAHFLESWGDARAFDGTISVIQPLIAPLYNGKSPYELIGAVLGDAPQQTAHELILNYWKDETRGRLPEGARGSYASFDAFWNETLRSGVMAGTAFQPTPMSLRPGFASASQTPAATASELEIVFRPDPTIWDGRFANNGWLQELPKPITKLTWDSVAMFSPQTAQRLGIQNEDTVDLSYAGRTIRAPVWVAPGHPNESVTVFLGYGRRRSGRVGSGVGFNAGWIRPLHTQWLGSGLTVHKTGAKWPLATTQHHSNMEGRDLVRVGTFEQFKKDPSFAQADVNKNPLSLYPEVKHDGYQWGMAIDINACTGCSACVIACQAENNISVVGKKEVLLGREMHWIRVDRYYEGASDDPHTYFEPVPCMHCEDAPCEVVCPVGATVHSSEGLNEMVYNRCVGTRYCSNNCPYKVRRFNFFLFSDWETPSLFGLRNPNVTVRSRGVMEKCTYCVQRINAAKIEAEKKDRDVHDGEIVTACQQTCPTEAIVFGNIADPASRVSKLKASTLNYVLLEELNTRPRTSYLAKLTNPNPEITKS